MLSLADSFYPGWLPPNLKPYTPSVSGVLALAGASFATLSIYAPPNTREADPKSKKRTGPAILILCFLVTGYWFLHGRPSDDTLNGIAMIGLGVSILRLMSQRERPF